MQKSPTQHGKEFTLVHHLVRTPPRQVIEPYPKCRLLDKQIIPNNAVIR